MRSRICFAFVCSWLAACAGRSEDRAPIASGGGANGGSAGGASLLSPVMADAGPESFAPSPVVCTGTPAPAPDVVRACVLAASCLPPLDVSLSECITERSPANGSAPPCWLSARSCAEVAACFGFAISPAPCPRSDFASVCDGDQVVACDVPRTTRDCRAVGGACRTYAAFPIDDPDQLAADCAVPTTCTGTNDTYVCDGTKRVRCRSGVAFGEDCAARGMACNDGPNGATCVASPAACAEPGVGHCVDGSKASFCGTDLRTVTIDCAPLGFECRDAPERVHGVRCDSPACSATEVSQCFEACDGNTAHLCLGGQRYSVDCRSFGLRGCFLDARPGVGDTARCGNE